MPEEWRLASSDSRSDGEGPDAVDEAGSADEEAVGGMLSLSDESTVFTWETKPIEYQSWKMCDRSKGVNSVLLRCANLEDCKIRVSSLTGF